MPVSVPGKTADQRAAPPEIRRSAAEGHTFSDCACEQFLPLEIKATQAKGAAAVGDFILEPDSKTIIEGLLPQSLRLQMFRVMRDSVASEHGARMTAMHKASDNAKELKDRLTLEYNNARQAAITNQIIEIVSGAEALG